MTRSPSVPARPCQPASEGQRATAPRPALIFADEPTGNLDAKTGEAVLDLLLARRAETGATLVTITHDAALAARCERVVTLADGRIASDTVPA